VQIGALALLSNLGQKAEDIAYLQQAIKKKISQNGEQVAMSPVALLIQQGQKNGGKQLCFVFSS